MAVQPYVVVPTPIGNGKQYTNNALGQAALHAALTRWFQAARTVGSPGWQLRPQAWLQVQTQPVGNTPGSILYNCGGIDPNSNGGYGEDFVDNTLVNWLQANLMVAGTQFQINNVVTPTSMYVGTVNGTDYHQDYFAVTATVKTIQYNQNDASDKKILASLGPNAQLFHGFDYQIIVNFHLYEGTPY